MSFDKSLKYVIAADDAPFASTLRRVHGQLNDVNGRVGGLFTGLGGSFARMNGMVASVSALLSGGAFVGSVKSAIDLQDEMFKASQKAGVTTEAFSGMAHAAKLADIDTDALTKTYAKLSVTLADAKDGQKDAVELLRRLRIDPAGLADADALLLALAERFESMPDGIRKTAIAVDVFGEKLGPRLIPFLNQGRAGITELRREAEKLGVVVGTEAGRQAEQFNDNLTRLGAASKGAANALANELLPSLIKGSAFFVQAAKDAGMFQAVLISIGALMAKGLGIDDESRLEKRLAGLRSYKEVLEQNLAKVQAISAANPESAYAGKAVAELTDRISAWRDEITKANAELARLKGEKDGRGAHGGGLSPAPSAGSGEPDPKKPTDTKAKAATAGPEGYMAYYELMLAEEKRAQAVLSAGREFGKQEELAYWRFLLDNVQVTTKDRVAILKRTADLEVDIARKAGKERKALDAEDIGAAEALALAKLAAERAAADGAVQLGEISRAQMLALEQEFEQRRTDIKRAALQARLELLAQDPDASPAERRRILNELLLLEQEFEAARQAIARQQKQEKGGGLDLWAVAERGMEGAISNILAGAQTLRQGLAAVWAQIRTAIAAEIARILVLKIAAAAKERAQALVAIATKAAEAGAGAAASQASIPVIGPALALAALATVFGAVIGLTGKVPSAARGWDIPRGMNPLTQLHSEEMVLPAEQANAIRELAAGGGAGAGAQFTVEVRGVPVGDWMMVHRNELARALNAAGKDKLRRPA